jgi:hypothetical protein
MPKLLDQKLWSPLAAHHSRRQTFREWQSVLGCIPLQSVPLIRVQGERAEFVRCPETGIPLEVHENWDGSYSALPPADSELDSRIDGLTLEDLHLHELNWQKLLQNIQRQWNISGLVRCLNLNPHLWHLGLSEGLPVCFAVLNSPADAEAALPFLQTAPKPRLLLPSASDKIFSALTRAEIQFQVLDSTPVPTFPIPGNKPASLYRMARLAQGWRLVFEGKEDIFSDMKGMQIIAHLLKNPPNAPIHVLELESAVRSNRPLHQSHIHDNEEDESDEDYTEPDRAQATRPCFSDRLQELNLNMDSKEIEKNLLRERSKYQELISNPKTSNGVKADAQTKIGQIDAFLHSGSPKHIDQSSKAYDRVRQQFNRIMKKLNSSQSQSLKNFAEHLQKRLIEPSRRFSGTSHSRAKAGVAQTFTYEPPPGVIWTD